MQSLTVRSENSRAPPPDCLYIRISTQADLCRRLEVCPSVTSSLKE